MNLNSNYATLKQTAAERAT